MLANIIKVFACWKILHITSLFFSFLVVCKKRGDKSSSFSWLRIEGLECGAKYIPLFMTQVWPCQGPKCLKSMRIARSSLNEAPGECQGLLLEGEWILTVCAEINNNSYLLLVDCSPRMLLTQTHCVY